MRTGCECPLAGYCARHGITKTNHEHKLCQNHPAYFKAWEEGRGPGQDSSKPTTPSKVVCEDGLEKEKRHQSIPSAVKPKCQFCKNEGCTGACRDNQKTPSLAQKAKNFSSAMKQAAKDGFKVVDNEEIERRKEICRGCEFFKPKTNTCAKCGCALALKNKLRSAHCPIGKWMVLFALLLL